MGILDILIPPEAILTAMAIFGIYGNTCIIVATVMNKSLQYCCNILIAFAALMDIFGQFNHIIELYYLLLTDPLIERSTCWYIMVVPYFGYFIGIIMVFTIGFDRLLCVLMPIKYTSQKQSSIILILMSCLPMIYLLTLSYQNMQFITSSNERNHQNNTLLCYIDALTPSYINTTRSWVMIGFSVLTICEYIVIWVIILKNQKEGDQTRRIMKSLTIIMLIIVLGYPIMFAVLICFLSTPSLFWYGDYVLILQNIGPNANYYIYFMFSSEYKKAFLRQIHALVPCVKKKQNNVIVISTVNKTINNPGTQNHVTVSNNV